MMNRKAILALAGITAATATVAAVSRIVSEVMMMEALDREESPVLAQTKQYIGGSKHGMDIWENTRQNAYLMEQREMERVTLTASDGATLVGHWYPAEHPRRVIVAMHGWRSGWNMDFQAITDFWRDNGSSILFAEQRGQGDSDGDYIGMGVLERFDCADWAAWAAEKSGNLPLYLAGVSLGAATVLMAANLPLPECTCGIMADCGYTSPEAVLRHVSTHNLHLPYCLHARTVDRLFRKKLHIGPAECSATEALRETRIPVLFFHGTADTFVPMEMTYENYAACASPKRLLIVPGAGHGLSYSTDTEGYQRMVLDFWRDFDGYGSRETETTAE